MPKPTHFSSDEIETELSAHIAALQRLASGDPSRDARRAVGDSVKE